MSFGPIEGAPANGTSAAGAVVELSRQRSGGTRMWTVPGMWHTSSAMSTVGVTANTDYYTPFAIGRAISVTDVAFRVTTGPGSAATVRVGVYASDDAGQPTGAPLVNEAIAVGSGATGVFSSTLAAPASLPAGQYLIVINVSVNMTLAAPTTAVFGGYENLAGTAYVVGSVARANAAFANPGTAWTTDPGFSVTHLAFMRYTVP